MHRNERPPSRRSVSRSQVTAFRLRHHHLAGRAPRSRFPALLAEVGGAQAQLLAAAELAMWARIRNFRTGEVETALWTDRTVARAWCMRRTLHLLPSEELAVFVRGTSRRAEREVRWMRGKGVTERLLDRTLEQVLLSLDEPTTGTELAERVGSALGARVRTGRGEGWGSQRPVSRVDIGGVSCSSIYLLHLAGARGVICSGPPRGNQATFVRADAWVAHWQDVPVERAERELLRRYLHAYGPGTPADFAAWTGVRLRDAQQVWENPEANLAAIDVEGSRGWVLADELSELEGSRPLPPSVRLLPYFDSFVLGHRERTHLVAKDRHATVYRPQGWVYPVVLVDGRVAGLWSHRRGGSRLTVRATAFAKFPPTVAAGIRAESDSLGRFLGCTDVDVRIA